jgi:hypothetical protein
MPCLWRLFQAINRALYRSMKSLLQYLILYTNLQPTGFLFLGNYIITQILFFSRAFNSSSMTLHYTKNFMASR